jgi:anti-sigma factor RsiW
MNTRRMTDNDIQALIDNELDWESEKHVRASIERDIHAQRRYEELMAQKALLKSWWRKKEH